MLHPTTLTALLTLALTATPALAQDPPATAPKFLPGSACTQPHFHARCRSVTPSTLAGQLGIARPSDSDQTNGIEAETRRAF